MTYSTQQEKIWQWFINGANHGVCEAVAGAGKSFTVIEGINRSKSPRMLYAIFGKRNQIEAEKKIKNPNCQISTYHSLGFKMILAYWKGVKANSYTEFNRCKMISPAAPSQVHFLAARLVDFVKNTFVTIPTIEELKKVAVERDIDTSKKDNDAGWTLDKLAELALNSIKLSLEYPKDRQISFNDMVYLPCIKGWVKPSFSMVISDEFQDASLPQVTMLKGLCEPAGRMFFVGDSKQQIFAFRGTVNEAMTKISNELKADKFTLSISYRCPVKVIELAKTFVPYIQAAPNAIDGEIIDCNLDTALKVIKPHDVILSRKNSPLVKTCLNLIKNKIPAYVMGRDIAQSLIKTIDDLEATSINDFYDKLETWLNIKQSKTGFNASAALEVATDTAETLKAIADSCLDIPALKNKINSIFFDSEYVKLPSVILSSIHKFKGMESQNIFVLMESFGSRKALTSEEQQQETNLKYVCFTRSLEKLYRIN